MTDNRSLQHRTPCNECPWRKKAVAGWLGGYSAEWYADVVQDNQVPSCHQRDFGPEDARTAYCVGSLHTAANGCIMPEDANEREARNLVGRSEDCFGHPALFYAHHTGGEQYQSRLMRLIQVKS